MNSRIRLYLAFMALMIAVLTVVPIMSAQDQPRSSQSQASPPSNSPAPSDQPQYRQNQNNTTTSPSSTTPTTDRYEIADRGFSWGTFLMGLVPGVLIGFLIGKRPRKDFEIRRGDEIGRGGKAA